MKASSDSLVHVDAGKIKRSAAIEEAAQHHDLDRLTALTRELGGLVDNELRHMAWPVLLGCADASTSTAAGKAPTSDRLRRRHGKEKAVEWARPTLASTRDLPAHPDEGQVKLDVDRSFVNLLDDAPPEIKARRREELQDVIVAVLRLHPDLNYFQGFHDIVSVFLLVLDDADLTLLCVEEMAVFRIRDSMGKTIEPVMGYLRLLKRIVQAADPAFAAIIDQAAHLPYFSLSWVLTLLSHDLPGLDSSARLFDFLIAHNPAIVAYLAAALVLEKRDAIDALQQDPDMADDPAMLHTTLSKLPTLAPSSVAPSSRSPSRRSSSDSLFDSASVSSLPTEADTAYLSDPDVSTPASKIKGPPRPSSPPKPDPLSIDELIERTLMLWRTHPLDDKAIAASELLGTNSCMSTWDRGLSVAEAEAIVRTGEDVVVTPPESPQPVPMPIKRRPVTLLSNRSMLATVLGVAGLGIAVALLGGGERSELLLSLWHSARRWWMA